MLAGELFLSLARWASRYCAGEWWLATGTMWADLVKLDDGGDGRAGRGRASDGACAGTHGVGLIDWGVD